MSSACPRGRKASLAGEYKGMDCIYDTEFAGKRCEFSNLIAEGNMTGVSRGFMAFPNSCITTGTFIKEKIS